MDIPSLSVAMSSASISRSVSVGVMKMALDQVEQTGEMIAQMMDAAYVDMGSFIDVKL